MKNKKVILAIFVLILLNFAIPFLNINYNPALDNQNNFTEDRKIKNTATKTAILRPNGDILTEWDGSPTPHWSRINEASPNGVYAKWVDGDENETEIYEMQNLEIPNINATKLYDISVTRVEIHVYGHRYYTGPAFARIYLGEWSSELELNLETTGSGWRTLVWDSLDGTYEELQDLQVNVTAGTWCSGPPRNGHGDVDTLYCEITYEITELPGPSSTIRPNEDILIEWDGSPTPHWSRINEASPNGVYAQWVYGDENQSDIFGMEELYFEDAIVTNIELHAYGHRYYTGPAFASIYLGEWSSVQELNLETTGSGWRTLTWNNLDGTYAELRDLQVNVTAGTWCSGPPRNGHGEIDTLYLVITIEALLFQINTPENVTYTEPMSGYFPATYGYEYVKNGQDDPDWVDGHNTCQVISSFQGHNKVYQCISGLLGCFQVWESEQLYGTVEYYMCEEDTSEPFQAQINRAESGTVLHLRMIDNMFQIGTGVGWQDIGKSAMNNTWYHIRMDFETTTSNYMGLGQWQWKLMINGEEYGPFNFNNNYIPDTLQYYAAPSVPTSRYWDAVAYSWDFNYNIEDNTREGLLLTYQTNINFNWIGYSLDGKEDITIYGDTTILPEDGAHSIQLFGNYSKSNYYTSEIVYFYLDIIEPLITIISPDQNEFFSSGAPNFEIAIEEVTLNTTWYSLDGGITNFMFTGLVGTIDQTEWDKFGQGDITLMFFANDSTGKIGKAEVMLHKDTSIPQVTIVSPNLNDIFNSNAPDFEISIDELYLESTWYTLDGGITNTTFTGLTGTIDQTIWDGLDDGIVTLMFYAKDSIGNLGKGGVIIHKDALIPQITIISPGLNVFYGVDPPDFEISIDEVYLESIWYTLDGGITNITITGLTGTIYQTIWDGLNEGLIIIIFCANDSYGHEGHSEVSFYKDVTPASSLISYNPYKQTNVVLRSTKFTITADDGSGSGISSIRYKINDSSWMEYSTSFDLSIYTLGYYQIYYQAIDNVGNVETVNFIVVKLEEIPTQVDSLPIIITVSAISGGAIIAAVVIYSFIRKKRKI